MRVGSILILTCFFEAAEELILVEDLIGVVMGSSLIAAGLFRIG